MLRLKKLDIKAILKAPKQRVIYMPIEPGSRKIITGEEETIKLWDVFGYENQKYDF